MSIDDKELLEMAAKAAGMHIDKSRSNGGGSGNTGFDMDGNAMLDWHNGIQWNPLKNDGDALRLAVKLGICITYGWSASDEVSNVMSYVNAATWAKTTKKHGNDGNIYADCFEWMHSNEAPECATRRAIVRAASVLGAAMP